MVKLIIFLFMLKFQFKSYKNKILLLNNYIYIIIIIYQKKKTVYSFFFLFTLKF